MINNGNMGHISGSPTVDGNNQPQTGATVGIPGYVPPAGWHVELTAPTIWDGLLIGGTTPMVFPTALGTAGQVLTTDGNGNLSWTAGGGSGSTPGGLTTQVQYNNAGSFGANDKFTYDGNGKITLGNATTIGKIVFQNSFGNTVTLSVQHNTSNLNLWLPFNSGIAQDVLATDGSGVLFWKTLSSATPGGGSTAVQYNNGTGFAGDTQNFTYSNDGTYATLSLGFPSFGQTGVLQLLNNSAMGGTQIVSGAAPTIWTLTLPTGPGTNGQVLQTNGSGVTSWVSNSTALDNGTTTITNGAGTGSRHLLYDNVGTLGETDYISTDGSNTLVLGYSGIISGNLRFNGQSTANSITVQPPANFPASWTLTLPSNDGTAGQFLQTDGSGVTSWAAPQTNFFIQIAGLFFYANIIDMINAQGITDAVGNMYVIQNALAFDATQSCASVPNTANFATISTATSITFKTGKTTTIITTSLAGIHSYAISSAP